MDLGPLIIEQQKGASPVNLNIENGQTPSEPSTINHLLEQLTASGLAVKPALPNGNLIKENTSTLKMTRKTAKSTPDNLASLVEDVKTQPYFKMFMNALEKEGIKKKEISLAQNDKTKLNGNAFDDNQILTQEKHCNLAYMNKNDCDKKIQVDNILEKLTVDSSETEHPRRPGLRKHSPKVIEDVGSFVKKRMRGRFKKRRGRRGRPKSKKENAPSVVNSSDTDDIINTVQYTNSTNINSIDTVNVSAKKLNKTENPPSDEIKAIEKDATKELMDALMKSAILKGKVASIQPNTKTSKIVTARKKSFKKQMSSNIESSSDCTESSQVHKSDHTPRYKYLTGFEDRPYSCPYCQGCFTKKSYLKQHVRTHTGEKPHECEICQRHFRQQAALKRHMMTHTGEKPFKCSECDKCYSDKAVLNEHIRVHTGEKPYLCHICTKAFAYTFSFKQHMKRHRGDRDHHCQLCEAKFYTASSLTTHIKKSHTGIRDAVCDLCGKAFVDKSDLARHRRKIHGGGNNAIVAKNSNAISNPVTTSNVGHVTNFSRNHGGASDQFSLMGAFTQHLMGAAATDPAQGSLQNPAVWGGTAPPPPHTPFPPTNIPWGGSTMWGQGNFSGYRP